MRNCTQIIEQMIGKIPTDKKDFINDLQKNRNFASYKAPENTEQWSRVHETLMQHIPEPKEDWEFEVLSIFTTLSIEALKNTVNLHRKPTLAELGISQEEAIAIRQSFGTPFDDWDDPAMDVYDDEELDKKENIVFFDKHKPS
jgi:hypothetical protein